MAVNFAEISLTRIIAETWFRLRARVSRASYFKAYKTGVPINSCYYNYIRGIAKTILIEDKQILNILHYAGNEH